MKQTILLILLCAGPVVLNISTSVNGQTMREKSKQQISGETYKAPFRYVIISNHVYTPTGDHRDTSRFIEVLLDEKAFSEGTLRQLFKLISQRFPKPRWLDVDVYTNLEQTETPEESDLSKTSESNAPSQDNYHWARLIRIDDDELFRYNPDPPSRTMKTVILKGKDPFGQ